MIQRRVCDVDEFELIRLLLPKHIPMFRKGHLGPGDDAAILTPPKGMSLAWSTDAAVEGVHFQCKWGNRKQHGTRAAMAALSDLAAMGAKPQGMLVSLSIPPRMRVGDLATFYQGIAEAADSIACPILGGNITRTHGGLEAHFSVIGTVLPDKALRRDGAQEGNEIWVTGALGLAGAVLSRLRSRKNPLKRIPKEYFTPPIRIQEGIWLSRQQPVTAAIDISDGLIGDLGHICQASNLNAIVDPACVPIHTRAKSLVKNRQALSCALSAGEDYELILCIQEGRGESIKKRMFKRFSTPMTRIGRMGPGQPGQDVRDTHGALFEKAGYSHFK